MSGEASGGGAAAGTETAAKKLILVVDDQDDEREIQRAMLEHLGYRVNDVGDGKAALAAAEADIPDLILLDVAMPKMDGLTVCRTLRENPALSETAILFYTASVNEDWEKQVTELKIGGILNKPVDPHEVAREIERLIGPPSV